MQKILSSVIYILVGILCSSHQAADSNNLMVEEKRIEKAAQQLPDVINRFKVDVDSFENIIAPLTSLDSFETAINLRAKQLWSKAVLSFADLKDNDDRPLYWARLQTSRSLRQNPAFNALTSAQQEALLWNLELLSRGKEDINFDKKSTKKILLTGFDPFFLDRHINQSNPSGAVALALDNSIINLNDQSVEIETLIVPVRFGDFDKGMIEQLLAPYIKDKSVDMVITVSMGRDDFDLERFPGAPGNLNTFTGATADNPLVPLLDDKPLNGPEFVEFSLPASKMLKAKGDFKINDNHKVRTTEKSFSPETLNELAGMTSVEGSGGGYLSNEVSYRSILLRDQYNPDLAVGHIHTPRFREFEPVKTQKIIAQLKNMIVLAITK